MKTRQEALVSGAGLSTAGPGWCVDPFPTHTKCFQGLPEQEKSVEPGNGGRLVMLRC